MLRTRNEVTFSKEDTLVAKGLAILFLLIHHCFLWPERNRRYGVIFLLPDEAAAALTRFSHICVGMFVFLSAYGMARLAEGERGLPDAEDYSALLHRWCGKLLRGFWAVFFPMLLLSALLTPEELKVYGTGAAAAVYLAVDALGLSMLFQTPTLMGTWWYMSFALLWIVLFPLFMQAYWKIGRALYPVVILLPYLLGIRTAAIQYAASSLRENMLFLLPTAVLGILCAQEHVFERIRAAALQWKDGKKCLAAAGLCAGWAVIAALHNSVVFAFCEELVVSVEAGYAVLFSCMVLGEIPAIRRALTVIGRHSMNIFLLHDFIRARFLEDLTYSFRYAPLIVLFLLAASLLCSILIEWIKRKIFDKIDTVRIRK